MILQTLLLTIVPEHQPKLEQSKLKISDAASVGFFFSCWHFLLSEMCGIWVHSKNIRQVLQCALCS